MKKIIVANWKMNPATLQSAKRLFDSIKKATKNLKNVEVVICPPFVYLSNVKCPYTAEPSGLRQMSNVKLGSQDCFWENSLKNRGAFTGEISALMLKNLGCQYVILGHSERRQYINETDEMISKKVEAVLKNDLRAILCIGETKKERETGQTKKVLKTQLKKCLKKIIGLPARFLANLIVVYEPVWAISPNGPCSVAEALEGILFIKKNIVQIFGQKIGKKIPIIYGGSINSQNAYEFLKEKEINGVLVGAASLNPDEFISIANQA
ncbi:triose-phosphate isomerase [Patescibacteria group bacterium]|nr:triose-phosphate isomerase [Patescibacteria group bacterium]